MAIHEFGCQPIEQGGMSRTSPVLSEIKNTRNDRLAEVPQPDVIDRNTRSQRIISIGNPAGER